MPGCQCAQAANAPDCWSGNESPPAALFGTDGRYWIGDGWHRIMAARQRGAETIAAELHAGGRQEALRHALGTNDQHGLRWTNADKRICNP